MQTRVHALIMVVLLGFAGVSHAAETRPTNPNVLGVELLGRGLLYTVTYDRMLEDNLAAGFGFGTVSTKYTNGDSAGKSASIIPAYVMYYFMKDQGSLFATGGAGILLNNGAVKGLKTSPGNVKLNEIVIPQFGLGFEDRNDMGFLFRATLYGMYGDGELSPWFGFHFGYAF